MYVYIYIYIYIYIHATLRDGASRRSSSSSTRLPGKASSSFILYYTMPYYTIPYYTLMHSTFVPSPKRRALQHIEVSSTRRPCWHACTFFRHTACFNASASNQHMTAAKTSLLLFRRAVGLRGGARVNKQHARSVDVDIHSKVAVAPITML